MGALSEPVPEERKLPATSAARVALVGVHGFGTHHLRNLERLQETGAVILAAVADPNPPAPGTLPPETAVFSNLDELLAATPALDLVIVATPIQTHAPLALAALPHADLYLEKPPVASLADFNRLQEAAAEAGRSVQIGFQSLGSHALQAIEDLLAAGEIGTLLGISATGRWVRDRAYYKRSRWAGKRSLNGVDVVDGVATNPLAHAIATALRIAGARTLDDLASVETDLYRANDIESDDTSVIRVRTTSGLPITCALTLCATESVEPYITLQGSEGTAVFHYTEDRLSVSGSDGERSQVFGRDDLTENLLEHLRRRHAPETPPQAAPLISPIGDSGAFMRVLEAIRTADAPALIPAQYIGWAGDGDSAHAVIGGIEDALERATAAHATFSELGLPWARPAAGNAEQPSLSVHDRTVEAGARHSAAQHSAGQHDAGRNNGGHHDGGRPGGAPGSAATVATLQDGTALAARLSPRPYLHPVRSLGGVTVTDHLPADHPWHLGAGIALQDVNGVNFWGGKTYTRASGRYEERPDHGRIVQLSALPEPGSIDGDCVRQELSWQAPDGSELLRERRITRTSRVNATTWRLDLATELTAVVDASLGGPGSNGAAGSGYGGFFWRLPGCSAAEVFTSGQRGEADVHGSVSPWLAWTAEFPEGPASLVFAAPAEAQDPWFVRLSGYPGVGSALAWDRPVNLAAGETVTRSFTIWIADGTLSPDEAARLAAGPAKESAESGEAASVAAEQ
jgi:predicted dehydrogenase